MKKLGLLFFILINAAFGEILKINIGSGIRNIDQKVDIYYLNKFPLASAEIKPTKIKFDKKSSSFIYAQIDMPLMPVIEFTYLEYILHASLSTNLDFYFGNIQVQNTNADIILDQDTKELNLDIYYSLPFLNFLKLGAGTNILDINLKAKAKLENGIFKEDSYSFALPILYIHSGLNFEKNRFLFDFKFRYLPKINIDEYNVNYLSILSRIGYKFLSLPTIKLVVYTSYEYSKLIIEKLSYPEMFYLKKKNNNLEVGGFFNLGF
ncbi:MAG TPA: hypothetical protein EYP03_01220 [Aquificae bacterium]|nr:hypothetical protein [Aquificota bacterium]